MNDKNNNNYLKLLSSQYPSISRVSNEIINLKALLNLPKGTEHFLSDIHGEDEAFSHVLRNGSGAVKRKIDEVFEGALLERDKMELATIIYYPREKVSILIDGMEKKERDEWFEILIYRLIKVSRHASLKYTRSMVREALPREYSYIIEELLNEEESSDSKHDYYQSIIETIIETERSFSFVVVLSELIQRLVVSRLHVIGDIFDRGSGAHQIMDMLVEYHRVDIQWGNHDILWMGAASGSLSCIANVIRVSLRYGNIKTLENGYGISMLPLASMAMESYNDDKCKEFKTLASENLSEYEKQVLARMHKAITVIQLKLEAQLIKKNPEFEMNDRLVLDNIDFTKGEYRVNGQTYPLKDTNFPTIDPCNTELLTSQEKLVIRKLKSSFVNSEKLQTHVKFLFSKGSVYKVHNGNLLYHGCIPLDREKNFIKKEVDGNLLGPREYLDYIDKTVRQGFFSNDSKERQKGQDIMWYLWSGKDSPLFGKDRMATFERYFLSDKELRNEQKNYYYNHRDDEDVCLSILKEFGLNTSGHIINGHVPVAVKKGESPVKANGKLIVIDGGFSKAYQNETGIAGYTLVHNSWGFILSSHKAFESHQSAVENNLDIHTSTSILEKSQKRIMIKDTDEGIKINEKIKSLMELLKSYRGGEIKEAI